MDRASEREGVERLPLAVVAIVASSVALLTWAAFGHGIPPRPGDAPADVAERIARTDHTRVWRIISTVVSGFGSGMVAWWTFEGERIDGLLGGSTFAILGLGPSIAVGATGAHEPPGYGVYRECRALATSVAGGTAGPLDAIWLGEAVGRSRVCREAVEREATR